MLNLQLTNQYCQRICEIIFMNEQQQKYCEKYETMKVAKIFIQQNFEPTKEHKISYDYYCLIFEHRGIQFKYFLQ